MADPSQLKRSKALKEASHEQDQDGVVGCGFVARFRVF